MNMFTAEETAFLNSLGCKNTLQEIEVIGKIIQYLPVGLNMFRFVAVLLYKLKKQ